MSNGKYPSVAFRTQPDTEHQINEAHRAFVDQYADQIDLSDYRGNDYSRSRFLEDIVRVSLGLATTNKDVEPFVMEAIRNGTAQTQKDIERYNTVVRFLTEHSKQILQAA